MISGRSSGSGKYSFHETSLGANSVLVSHMPEDQFHVRIVFRSHGENHIPVLKLHECEASLLWASLSRMAKDLGWDDRLASEMVADAVSKGGAK